MQETLQVTIHIGFFLIMIGYGILLAASYIAMALYFKNKSNIFVACNILLLMMAFLVIFQNADGSKPFFYDYPFVINSLGISFIAVAIFLIAEAFNAIVYFFKQRKIDKIEAEKERERRERLSKIR